MRRAEIHEHRYRQPTIKAKDWLQNALAGAPSEPDPPPAPSAATAELAAVDVAEAEVASRLLSAGPVARDGMVRDEPGPASGPVRPSSDSHSDRSPRHER